MKRKLVSFDWAMKKLLRSKANFGILEGFLSELLFDDITILEVLESESNQNDFEDKFNRVDLKVKDKNENLIIIEVQYDRQLSFLHRILYSSSKVITEHLNEGESYSKISKVISVNILYFELGEGDDYIYIGKTNFFGMHNKTELKLSDKQKQIFNIQDVSDIYPDYYLLEVTKFDNVAKNTLDEWIYFLKNEEIKDDFSAKGIKEAKAKLDVLKMNEPEREQYELYQKKLHQDASMYESHYVSGKLDGLRQGIKEGIKEGEKQKALKIAKSLLDVLDIETICKKTGLTQEEICSLKK